MAIVAVDFDGTLVRELEDGSLEAIPGAREALIKLRNLGHRVVIHSCRTGIASESGRLEDELRFMEDILDEFGIPHDGIYTGSKFIADIYIDDRAIGFRDNWEQAMAQADRKLLLGS